MDKIGILTFHASHNCGSILQTFALQQVLTDKYGCDVEIIDFSNPSQQNMYAPIPKPHNYKQFIKAMIWMTNYGQMKKQHDAYTRFIEKYLHLSEKKYSDAKEIEYAGKYTKLIAGSDQVWNVCCIDADDAYYMNFAEGIKKYTYAVSFGANNVFKVKENKADYIKWIEDIKYISVREKNAKKWIEEETGRDVSICLDPTMLLKQEQWEKYIDIGDKPIIEGRYLFYYCFEISFEIEKFLKKISQKENMPVYFMEAKEWTLKCCWLNQIKLIKEYAPDVFLNVVKNADMIMTTSFHGTAFSTIFRKNFWYIDSGHNSMDKDDRAITFLNQLKLMSRYKTTDQLLSINLKEVPDFSECELALEELQKQSFDYIEKILKD